MCANHDLGGDRDPAVTLTVNPQISHFPRQNQSAEQGRLAKLRPGELDIAVSFWRYRDLARDLFKVTGPSPLIRRSGAVGRATLSRMALGYRLQSNPLVGKLTTKYLLPLGTRQFGDDVVFFNFGYEEDPPIGLPFSRSMSPTGTAFSSTT